jgi:hypothetical protein
VSVGKESLFRPDNSLFASGKIPVPPGTGNDVQAAESTGKTPPENRPKGRFS